MLTSSYFEAFKAITHFSTFNFKIQLNCWNIFNSVLWFQDDIHLLRPPSSQIFKICGLCQIAPKIWIKKLLNVDQLLIWCSTPILKHLKLLHTFLPLRETPLKIEGAGAKNRNFLNFKIQLNCWNIFNSVLWFQDDIHLLRPPSSQIFKICGLCQNCPKNLN